MPLLLILTVACCCFNVGLALFDPEATFIKAKDRVTAQDIYMEVRGIMRVCVCVWSPTEE